MSSSRNNTRPRLPILAAVLAASTLAIAGCGSDPEPLVHRGASIVLIDVSGLRADRLAAAGALERLADESVSFEWAFTPSPHAGPARASLLSGRYPIALGLLAEGGTVSEETVTLAERLGEGGYRTAAFVGDSAAEDAVAGLDQGFGSWQEVTGGPEGVFSAALEWARDGEAPFFLYVQAPDLAPTAEEREAALADAPSSETADSETADREAASARLDELYDARVRALDGPLGSLLAFLDQLETPHVVALASDHGAQLAEREDSEVGDVHAAVARVPLLLRLPERVSRVEPRVTDLVALAPTLLDLVGMAPAEDMQGESLVAVLDQRGRPPYLAFTDSIEPEGGLAVAMAGYRLVLRRADDRAELFRLSEDPLELADLSAAEPEKVAVLRRRLEEWQRGVVGRSAGGEGETDDEMLDQLRNLGYIQ